jgi:serine/threonine protein kinase
MIVGNCCKDETVACVREGYLAKLPGMRRRLISCSIAIVLLFVVSAWAEDNIAMAANDQTSVYNALDSFYATTQGGGWRENANWGNRTISFCRWYGICCDSNPNVDPNDCGLPNWNTGDFSASCCQANGSVIRAFVLSQNNVSGSIPSDMGALDSLAYIYLRGSSNSAYQTMSGTIPPSLLPATLRVVDLSGNALSGSIPSVIGDAVNLTTLILKGNSLSGSIPSTLGDCPKLTQLQLNDNQVSGTIPATFGNLIALTNMDLSSNYLSGDIPSGFSQLRALEQLSLDQNALSGTLPTLQQSGGAYLPSLTSIDLSSNSLEGTLHAGWSMFGNTINRINLGSNRLEGSLPESWKNLTELTYLDCSSNSLEGVLPAAWSSFGAIQFLFLQSNRLEGSLPSAWGNMSALIAFYADRNDLSGLIPESLLNISTLSQLSLYSNQLSGSLSSKISAIEVVALSVNKLSGNLPDTSLVSTKVLRADRNLFSGTVPKSWCTASKMEELHLSENSLSGSFPECLFTIASMNALSAASNMLSNVFKFSLSNNFPAVSNVDLHGNKLSGDIQFFGSFSALSDLNIQGNLFAGDLSLAFYKDISDLGSSVQFLGVLSYLGAANNMFTSVSKLPPSITNLNVAQNQLNGNLNALNALESATVIDIRGNPVSGGFPEVTLSSKSLIYFYGTFTSCQNTSISRGQYSISDARHLNLGLPYPLMYDLQNMKAVSDDHYSCPVVKSSVQGSELIVDFDAYYYQYIACSCDLGYEGDIPSCSPCQQGYYRGDSLSLSCSPCPAETFTHVKGASSCTPCPFPQGLVISNGTDCLNLVPVYLSVLILLIFSFLSFVTFALFSLVTAIAGKYVWRFTKRIQDRSHQAALESNAKVMKQLREKAAEEQTNLQIEFSALKLGRLLNFGAFGEVYLGRYLGTPVAIKKYGGGLASDESPERDLMREFRVLRRFHHPNVILFCGYCIPNPREAYAVLEYMARGSLRDVLESSEGHDIGMKVRYQMCLDITRGLQYVHSQGFAHLDVKSENMLVSDAGTICLADFDAASPLESGTTALPSRLGSILWMSPEMALERRFSNRSDVYSFGIVMWEIMTGHMPFANEMKKGENPVFWQDALSIEVWTSGRRPKIPPMTPLPYGMLMSRCWRARPTDRPSIADVVQELGKCMEDYVVNMEEELSSASSNLSSEMALSSITNPLHSGTSSSIWLSVKAPTKSDHALLGPPASASFQRQSWKPASKSPLYEL